MTFARSKVFVACALVAGLGLTACSKSNNEDSKQTTLTASAPATGEASTLTERNAQQRLMTNLEKNFKTAGIKAKITDIKATEVPNLYWVSLEGMSSVYATSDGKYILQGDVIRLGGKSLYNVSENLQANVTKKQFAALKAEDLLIYPAKGKAKHVIYVFTDVSCPYCHKFHEQMDEMNAKGIEVRYIAWPRGEEHMPAMEAIWCSENRREAFDLAIAGGQIPAGASCKNPVREQYQMGLNIGVNGTPGVYNAEGLYLGGYMSTDELLNRLK
ncbi:thiol:disulfide interchange protein [Acinetobacter sp. NCu2D-2]|uniref:DsbC family protein n=1 Tax=Acinetobacter sp. NCu2D-2 TaxID=1608473 RepID=UPI0007CE0186|nr:DsbC family protein [Acinetobacter sp. NCu2D-2]ANF82764.1 thiol:disulfide interchange protein [Acinetobacter sp. NCu2D-2]